MARHAIINNETKKVVNVVIWEGKEWLPPKNHLVVQSDSADVGDDFDEKSCTFKKNNLSKPDSL